MVLSFFLGRFLIAPGSLIAPGQTQEAISCCLFFLEILNYALLLRNLNTLGQKCLNIAGIKQSPFHAKNTLSISDREFHNWKERVMGFEKG